MYPYQYITNASDIRRSFYTQGNGNQIPAEAKLLAIQQALLSFTSEGDDGEHHDGGVENIVNSMKEFVSGQSFTDGNEYRFILRISKWLLVESDKRLRHDKRIIEEYCRLLDMAVVGSFGSEKFFGRSIYPPYGDGQLWEEMVNYCLYLIDCVDTVERGYAIVYALRYFVEKDNSIADGIRERRSNIIDMVTRLTRYPKEQGFIMDHSFLVYWTVILFENINAQAWDGTIHVETTLERFQELFLRALIATIPERVLERHYSRIYEPIRPNDILTGVFNMVNSCYLVNGESVSSLFDSQFGSFSNILLSDQLVSIANIILTNSDVKLDELVVNSCAISLTVQSKLNLENKKEFVTKLCKLVSVKLCTFLRLKEKLSPLHYSIVDLYSSLCKNNSFESYCEHFENDETREFISNTILSLYLDEYMKSRVGGSDLCFSDIVKCFETFERSGTLLDKRLLTLIVDFGDTQSDIWMSFHRGGYCQVHSIFKSLAFNIQNRSDELMSLLDDGLCNHLENVLEIFVTGHNDDGWFLVLCQLLDCGLFWKIIEKSRQSKTPSFSLSEKFKQGYSLELVKKVRENYEERNTEKPQFSIFFILWLFLMENVEPSRISITKKNQLYDSLVTLSLVVRDYDCGHANDSSFFILLLAELGGYKNMDTILANIDTIISAFGEQWNRHTNFVEYCTERILENVERLVDYAITNQIPIPSLLASVIVYLPGYHEYSYLTQRIATKLEQLNYKNL